MNSEEFHYCPQGHLVDCEEEFCETHSVKTYPIRDEERFIELNEDEREGMSSCSLNLVKEINKMTYEAAFKGGFEKVLVPEDAYEMKFIGVKPVKDGEFGKRIAFEFEIVGGTHAGKRVSKVVYENFTQKSRGTAILTKLSGVAFEKDKKIDLDKFIGCTYLASTENVENDFGDYSVVKEIIKKQGGSQ